MAIRIPYTKYSLVRPQPTAEMYHHFKTVDRIKLKAELREQRREDIRKRSALTPGYNKIIKWLLIFMVITAVSAAISFFVFSSEESAIGFLAVFALLFIIGSVAAIGPSATQSSYAATAHEKERLFLRIERIAKKSQTESHFYALYDTQGIPAKAFIKIGIGVFVFLFGLITRFPLLVCSAGTGFIAFGAHMLYERSKTIQNAKK